jgi:hypothetical protein
MPQWLKSLSAELLPWWMKRKAMQKRASVAGTANRPEFDDETSQPGENLDTTNLNSKPPGR